MRRLLVALLAASTVLFAVGAIAEPSPAAEPVAAHEESGHGAEKVGGVRTESTPLVVAAVAAGLALAFAVSTRLGRRRAFLVAVAAVALAWAVLDAREVAHQVNESRAGIAAIAAVVALLHLAAAAVASRAATRQLASGG